MSVPVQLFQQRLLFFVLSGQFCQLPQGLHSVHQLHFHTAILVAFDTGQHGQVQILQDRIVTESQHHAVVSLSESHGRQLANDILPIGQSFFSGHLPPSFP